MFYPKKNLFLWLQETYLYEFRFYDDLYHKGNIFKIKKTKKMFIFCLIYSFEKFNML